MTFNTETQAALELAFVAYTLTQLAQAESVTQEDVDELNRLSEKVMVLGEAIREKSSDTVNPHILLNLLCEKYNVPQIA